MRSIYVALLALALAPGCGDKKDDKGGGDKAGSAKAAGGDKAGGGSASEWKDIELPELGLIANAPGDAKLSKLGGLTAMGYDCQPMMNTVSDMSPSYENTKTNVDKGHQGGPLAAYAKDEKTDDKNWVLDWKTDKKWGYASRRVIGDKEISCGRVSADEAGHKCVVKVCESLRAK